MAFVITRRGSRVLSLRGASLFVNVTSGSGVSTKGAWTELVAALPKAIRGFDVYLIGAEVGIWFACDVGIGAAGAERVIAPDLLHQTFNDFNGEGRIYRFPYALPAGARLSMRAQTHQSAPKVVRCALVGHVASSAEGPQGAQRIVQYGLNLGTTFAVSVDPGGTAAVKGAWVTLAAATTAPIRRLMLSVVPVSAVVFMAWNADIGVGAAGAEVVLVPDIPFGAADIGKAILPPVHTFDVSVPAGARLSVRAACESNSNPARIFAAQLIGMG